jgi:hypothetical protein
VSNRFRISSTLQRLNRRLCFPHDDLFTPPEFYDFVYRLSEAFEGREAALPEQGSRYELLGRGWLSSFGELVRMFHDRQLEKIVVTTAGIFVTFSVVSRSGCSESSFYSAQTTAKYKENLLRFGARGIFFQQSHVHWILY